MKYWIVILVSVLTMNVWADNDSTIVLDNDAAQQFDAKLCIDQYTNHCVNTICLTSDDRDCQEKCNIAAKDKCQLQGHTPVDNLE